MDQPFSRPIQIPDKKYFRIGEVSDLIGVEAHVLRYWESEFKEINPRRTKSKQRLYRKEDVEILFQIRSLLHEQGYTINGARKFLTSGVRESSKEAMVGPLPKEERYLLVSIKKELKKIHQILLKKIR